MWLPKYIFKHPFSTLYTVKNEKVSKVIKVAILRFLKFILKQDLKLSNMSLFERKKRAKIFFSNTNYFKEIFDKFEFLSDFSSVWEIYNQSRNENIYDTFGYVCFKYLRVLESNPKF